ncbi:N-acetyltransferase ESCO2 [Platysternon megacephalum]|uniref:N-acetyltransferase ESCO2 n=1 Tax=Platysternon megacephalum TaxID=55544 RepID=A0A4D9E0R5_9SAUR|nr:N-acetyltransferase ESCO2 [Platysternon megacephalum]
MREQNPGAVGQSLLSSFSQSREETDPLRCLDDSTNDNKTNLVNGKAGTEAEVVLKQRCHWLHSYMESANGKTLASVDR